MPDEQYDKGLSTFFLARVINSLSEFASSSLRTNIAEGCGRESDADFRRFLIIAHGSATEVEYLVFLSFELEYVSREAFKESTDKIVILRKQLRRLIDKLK